MTEVKKLLLSEKTYWGTGDYGVFDGDKLLFQGTLEACLQWLGGN